MSKTLLTSTFSRGLALTASALSAVALAATAPTQTPLTSRSGSTPPPNVMITLDDSGSMLFDAMPEGSFTLNSKTVTLQDDYYIGVYPGDPRKAAGTCTNDYGCQHCTAPAIPGGGTVFQRQFRSPDVNSIYYNPDVRYLPWLNPQADASGNGVRRTAASFTAARWDPIYTYTSNTVNLSNGGKSGANTTTNWCTDAATVEWNTKKVFNPALVYRLKSGSDPTKTTNYTEYNLNDSTNYAPATKAAARTDCAGTKCTQDEEKQNFANWFTYYRMREFMAKGAVTESFFNFKDKIRAGWGRINKTTASSVDSSGLNFKVVEKPILPLDATHLNTVLSGVQNVKSKGSTPLRHAVSAVGAYFYKRTDAYSPWVTTPGATTAPGNAKLACRRAVNVLTTDGYYNSDKDISGYTTVGDKDTTNSSFSYPYDTSKPLQNPGNFSPTTYTAKLPFMDSKDGKTKRENTLADFAMRWYIEDLDPTIANQVAPVDGDIAFWQHLTQFTVGIGVKGTLDSSTAAAKLSTLASLTKGDTQWPDPTPDTNDSSPAKIDDLWHAAVNTGGDFYSVKNVTELTSALANAFGKAVGNESREAGVATVASTLTTNNVKFVPQYKSGAWYGDVLAYQLDSTGNVQSSTPKWRASTALPAHGSRKLFTWGGTAGAEFSTSLDATSLALISSDSTVAKQLVGYIRGDTTNEGAAASFRSRNSQLIGDIINSPPVYVRDQIDMGYGSLGSDKSSWASSYAAYLTAKKARTAGVLAVGGNDGIFHLFRDSDGQEAFGYVPRAGFGKFASIAAKTYGSSANFHQYVVDGPTIETDAYIVPKGGTAGWTNMLVSSLGAGGKALFALNLPTADPTPTGASNVQWELSDDADLGYLLGDMAVGTIHGNKLSTQSGWYAFVGNGAYSKNGNAVLLVIDLQSGAVVARIKVPTTGANGLGGVHLLRNANREVYAAYAGDLQGNLWRFDFGSGSDTSTWKVGFGEKPLFVAQNSSGTRQPIVSAPVAITHPTQGHVILFGTGRLIDDTDASDTSRQTFYGVWDNTAIDTVSASTGPFEAASQTDGAAPYRNVLVAQTIDTTNVVTGTQTTNGVTKNTTEKYYYVSANTVNWASKKGWYLDLTIASGQRMIYTPQRVLDYVYLSTMVPAAPAAECEFNVGTGYNFVLDALTGAAPVGPIFDVNNDGEINDNDRSDTNHDGQIDDSDNRLAGNLSQADGIDKLLTAQEGVVGDDPTTQQCLEDVNGQCPKNYCLVVIVNTSSEAESLCLKKPYEPVTPPTTTKVVTDRVWRQILNPPTPAVAP